MIQITETNSAWGLVKASALKKDITKAKIKEVIGGNICTGSSIFAIDTIEIFFYDKETDNWLDESGNPIA